MDVMNSAKLFRSCSFCISCEASSFNLRNSGSIHVATVLTTKLFLNLIFRQRERNEAAIWGVMAVVSRTSPETTINNKPTNVGRIALARQARQFNSGAVALINFFFMGAKKIVDHDGIRTMPTRLSGPSFCYAAIDFILATSFTSEWEQSRSLKNEERKREKVTW